MGENIEVENRFTELVDFVRGQIGEYKLLVIRETLIEDGLGVTGDEAEELIINFAKKYNVDITNFDITKYFYDEPSVFNPQSREIKPFTIGHLEKAMIAGRLDEEIING
ncbi:DUF1493 family protein [Parasediminibacterium paludis]|uniref:DUF1493 family protein n=1 Tax=Parasediminibacterium paludis TaxID=908966 RepID=A0ABV8PU95_9BACT